MNEITLIGRLTKDPELNKTSTDKAVSRISIAVNRPTEKDEADYFDVSVWNVAAENAVKYLKKGSKIAVHGSMRQNRYETKEGEERVRYEVLAARIEYLDSATNTIKSPLIEEIEEEEIPYIDEQMSV